MIAFGQAVANLRRIKDQSQQPENIDALTVLETQTNLGAVSSKNAQDAGEKAVKVPPPEITVTFGPDGEPLVTATNLPLKSGVQQVREAQAAPFARFADTLKATIEQSARLAEGSPDPEKVGDDPAALARELGVERPGLDRDGLLGYAGRLDKYDKLLRDLPRLKQMVAAQRLKNKRGLLDEGSAAYRSVKGIEADKRAEETQERQEKAFVFRVLGDKDFKMSRVAKSPAQAVDYMKQLAGDTWDDSFAPFVEARYADELIEAAEKKSDDLRKQREDQRKDERLEKYLSGGGGRPRRIPRSKSYLDRLSPETIASFIDDEDVDQESAWEAVDMAEEQWVFEGEKNSAEHAQNLAKINAGVAGGMKKADVEALKERNKYLERRNRYLNEKRTKLSEGVAGKRQRGSLVAPTTPSLGGRPAKKDSLGIR